MTEFYYTAKDAAGKDYEGEMQANTSSEVAAALRERGFYPVSIKSRQRQSPESASGGSGLLNILGGLGPGKRLQFYQQLGSFIQAGATMSDATASIASVATGKIAQISQLASLETRKGLLLSDVLKRTGSAFPAAEVALIEIGERGGTLEQTITANADLCQFEIETRRELLLQMLYPVMVFFGIAFIPLFPTLFLHGVEAFLRAFFYTRLPFVVIALLAYFSVKVLCAVFPPVRLAVDTFKIKFPILGAIPLKMATSRVLQIIGIVYRAGISLSQAVEYAADGAGNAAFSAKLRRVAPEVRAGAEFYTSLARHHVLPARAMQMMATGIKTGNLDELVLRVAEDYRAEAKVSMRVFAIVAGVLALIIAGIIVLFMLINFYTGGINQTLEQAAP